MTVYGHSCVVSSQLYIKVKIVLLSLALFPGLPTIQLKYFVVVVIIVVWFFVVFVLL